MTTETTQKSLTDRIVEAYVAFIWRHRPITLAILLALTAFWAYQATKVEMYSQFADLLPQGHPYIQAYNQHRDVFGGANIVTLVLQVKEGDIFTTEALKKVRHVTEQVDLIDGVDHNQVASISHVKIRNIKTLPGGMIRSYPVLPVDIPTDPQELQALKFEMSNNDIVLNKYISADGRAALILAGFNEDRLDYREIQRELSRIRSEVEDANTSLFIAGEPALKGWVWYYTNELFLIFTFTGVFVVISLIVYFRRTYGVVVPLIGAVIQGAWGMGWVGWWGANLDPLILVIPLLITARAVSHGVQMVERYFEELEATKDQERSAFTCMNELFLPGFTGVISDAGGILVLAIVTIPLIQKLAFYSGSFWALANLFCITHLMPILLSYFPRPNRTEHFVPHWMQATLYGVGRLTTGPVGRWVILAANVVIIVVGIRVALSIPIGEQEAGSPLLWQDSHYNVSARAINERFAGANQLVIYLEGEREHILKEPYVLATLEEMRRYMLEQEEAGDTRDLYTLARGLNRLYHYNDPRWQVIPPDLATTGNLIFVYEASAPISGVILEYTDLVYKNGQFVVFYKDTKGDTVREAIARAKKFIAEHPLQGVKMRLAGGFIGTTAALNEEIAASERQATLLVVLTVYLLVWGSYGSFVAANMVMIALIAAGVASYMYISFMGIGMNINSLPVTAVGMGIGVDYILYVVDRIRREVPAEGSMINGIKRAISTTGMAVTFTATTMIAGIIPWYFMSSLRFSAEMALLLAILLVTHWLSALLLTPALFAIIRPKFAQGEGVLVEESRPIPVGAQAQPSH
jgi:uncharacterized protein